MPFLMKKGRFAECMILGWQEVEDKIDQMTVQEFHLLFAPQKDDPRVDMLREVNLRKKIEFLKVMGRISEGDASVIHRFSDERNKLFHGDVFRSAHPINMAVAEKNRLMELANKASQIASNRTFGVWFDEGTGDMGNKNVVKPDKPRGVRFTDDLLDGSLKVIADTGLMKDIEEVVTEEESEDEHE